MGFFGLESSSVPIAAAIARWLQEQRRPDADSSLEAADPGRYLRSLLAATSLIDIRGLQVGSGKAHRFPIDDLFMSLTTTRSVESTPEQKGARQKSRARSDHPGHDLTVPLHTALTARRLVVVGDPGSGKSTFLRRVAHALCETGLDDTPGRRANG